MITSGAEQRIHLGYEVGTGEAVSIPMRHTVVTGLTQQSGKTSTCEALVSRLPAGFRALVFRTKRGDLAFDGANAITPFYRQESGWEYVLSVLEAAVKQKLRLERSFIIKACQGTETLRQVYENIVQSRDEARRGFDESVLTVLAAYFEKVLPQIEEGGFADTLELATGANVMDLTRFSEEVQALVISSCLTEIWRHATNTLVIIPEAWAFIPQSRGNPVKWAAQHVIRQGAASGVYLVLDSQDITGIDKAVLKSVDCWLMGRQREINEVKRVLDQLPPSGRPSAEAITRLRVGHFFVSTEDWCKEVYVQPAWLDAKDAKLIALGESSNLANLEALARVVGYQLGVTFSASAEPLQALKHRYQQETSRRIVDGILALDAQQRRVLEWLLAVGGTRTYKNICAALGVPTAGNSYNKLTQAGGDLVQKGWLARDTHGVAAAVREKVQQELAPYAPTDQEVEQVFQHVVAELASKKEGRI